MRGVRVTDVIDAIYIHVLTRKVNKHTVVSAVWNAVFVAIVGIAALDEDGLVVFYWFAGVGLSFGARECPWKPLETIAWLILVPIFLLAIAAVILSSDEEYWNNLGWDDLVLSTKIQYEQFSKRPGSPVIATLSSTRVIISVLASLATIASFIFVIASR